MTFSQQGVNLIYGNLLNRVNAENNAVVVTSFSKVTFGGGGLSFLAASGKNLELIKRMRASMVICPDKINQKKTYRLL